MTNSENGTLAKKIGLLALLALGVGLVFAFDLHTYLSFESLKENREALGAFVEGNFLLAALAFMAIYALVVAASIPGATWMTLGGGLVFGLIWGTVFVVTAATIGAVAIFLIARYVVGEAWVEKFGPSVKTMEKGFQENEVSYMLVLRLVPLFPFWLVNLAPALLGVHLRTYIWTTFLGIIPGAVVYIGVGNGLDEIIASGETPDLGIIFAPQILLPLLGLAALALLPVAYKKFKGTSP